MSSTSGSTSSCPHCGRSLALVRPTCLYCGKPLPAELVTAAAKSAAETVRAIEAPAATSDAGADRALLILDLRERHKSAEGLGDALGVSAFEAEQRWRRGGYQLHRVTTSEQAAAEAARLAGAGVRVVRVDEAGLPAQPIEVTGGTLAPGRLLGRTAEARFEWACDDLLLIVRGPIQRERVASAAELKRVRSATPSAGYRFHLHRSSDRRPLEIDPDAFEFGGEAGLAASSLLRLTEWLDAFEPKAKIDDGFRLLPPALAPAVVNDSTARALGGAAADKKKDLLLDNLGQFRFYSAWRGAVERPC